MTYLNAGQIHFPGILLLPNPLLVLETVLLYSIGEICNLWKIGMGGKDGCSRTCMGEATQWDKTLPLAGMDGSGNGSDVPCDKIESAPARGFHLRRIPL